MLKKLLILLLVFSFPSIGFCAWKFNPHTAKPDYYESGTDQVGAVTNGKWCIGDGTLVQCTEDAPAGAGDVTDVGDCTGGACLDGTSDGGTWIKFYDAQGAGTLITGNLTAAHTWTLPNEDGTICTSGSVCSGYQASGSYITLGSLSATNPITYNNGTGAIGWTNSENYITLTGLSATNPIVYNNTTGAITWTNSEGYLTAEVDGSTTNELPTAGTYIDVSGQQVSVDLTEVEGATWGAGGGASNAWTFDLSGTDVVVTFGSDLITLSGGLTLTTGKAFKIGTTQWNSGDSIDGTKVANADLGDIGVSSGVWSVENDSHDHSAAGSTVTINAADITDKNAGTDITADLEEEAHASEHAVSAADTVFPADPNADRLLMWDDDPGALAWLDYSTWDVTAYTGGDGLTLTSHDFDFTATELEGLTWGGGAGASIVWTFDVSGTDTTVTFGNNLITIGQGLTVTGTTTVGTLAGTIDAGAATSLEVPNGADPTTNAAGEIAIDSSAAPGSGIRFYGDAAYTLPGTQSISFVVGGTIANTTDFGNLWKVPYNITVKSVNVTLTGGAASWSIVGHVDECDANGANCAGVDGATDITCTQATNAADDGTLSNPSIDANDWVGWHTTSQTWTTGGTAGVTINYVVDQVN